MKKIAIYGLTAMLSMAFVACDNYEEPNPAPQTNAQDAVLQTSDVTVTPEISGTYDLQALNLAGQQIALGKVATDKLPAGYTFEAAAEISTDGFSTFTEVPATVEADSTGHVYTVDVDPDALQTAYKSKVTKNPATKTIQVRYALYTVIGNMKARVGGPTQYFGPYEMSITPYPAAMVIEDAYYIYGTINNGEGMGSAVKLNHGNTDVYDDPVFTIKVDITAEQAASGWWWMIIPQSTKDAGKGTSYGVMDSGDESLAGDLISDNPSSGCVKDQGPYLLTINLEQGTYEFSMAIESLYTPGNSNGWNQGNSQQLFTENYADYFGYAHLNGDFKFTSQPDWNGINYGAAADEGKLSTDGGAGNLSAPADGLYWCEANISSLTYSLAPVTTYGLIGDGTPGGWDASTALTPSADFLIWSADVELKAGEFKFRANDAWDINLGGEMDNLTPGGANIKTPGAGKYHVELNLGVYPYSCTLTAL